MTQITPSTVTTSYNGYDLAILQLVLASFVPYPDTHGTAPDSGAPVYLPGHLLARGLRRAK